MRSLLLAGLVILGACGGKQPAAAPAPEDEMQHCGWYARAVDDYGSCETAPDDDQQAARAELAETQAGLADYESWSTEERADKDQACWEAYGDVVGRMKASGCTLPPGAD